MNAAHTDQRDPTRFAGLRRWLTEDSGYFARPARIFRTYRRAYLRPDLVAGLTVAVILLPQAIAYAMIADLPPQMGLYGAIIAAIVGALWGSSNHLHTGPTNAASLLVLASLLTVAQPGTPEFLVAAGYMAIIVGVIRLLMGLLRMGVLVNFVSDSVVVGFSAGAGILISFNQLRHLLRLDIHSGPKLVETVAALAQNIGDTHLLSLGVGAGTILVIVIVRKVRPTWPAALIATVLAAVVTGWLGLDRQGLKVLGALPRNLPPLADLPVLDFNLIWQLTPGALAVATIGLVEAMSVARSIAAQTGQYLDSNQELLGQGLANIASGFFSGYAVSGSFTRSAVIHSAGGRTPLAAVFSGLWVLVAMVALAPLARYLPRAALAGVLLVIAWGMIDRLEMRRILRTSRGDGSILLATLAGTVLLPLEFAVLTGVLVSFARYLIKTSTPGVYPMVPDRNFRHFVRVLPGDTVCPQMGVVNIEGSLYFGAVAHVEEALRRNQEQNSHQIFLLLRMHMVDHCDISGIHMLKATVDRYRRRSGDVYLDRVRPRVMQMIHLYGFDQTIGEDHILTTDDVIGHMFHKVLHPGICVYECPHRVFAECQALPKDDHAMNVSDLAALPEHEKEFLTPSGLRLLMADPETELMVIDIGEPAEFRNWHIHGAVSLPLRRLRKEGPKLDRKTPICFVGRTGRRSVLAARIMQDLGHEQVFVLRGGMLAWEAAGFPIAVE